MSILRESLLLCPLGHKNHTPSDPVGREYVPCYGAAILAMNGEPFAMGFKKEPRGGGGLK